MPGTENPGHFSFLARNRLPEWIAVEALRRVDLDAICSHRSGPFEAGYSRCVVARLRSFSMRWTKNIGYGTGMIKGSQSSAVLPDCTVQPAFREYLHEPTFIVFDDEQQRLCLYVSKRCVDGHRLLKKFVHERKLSRVAWF